MLSPTQRAVRRARKHAAAGRLDAAIEGYRWAIARAPHHAAWHHELGEALTRTGQHAAAADAFAAAVAREPQRAKWHHQLGRAQYAAGQVDAAIKSYREAVNRASRHPGWHHDLGVALDRAGDHAAAAQAFEAALALAPDRPKWQGELGKAYRHAGQPASAIEAYRAAVRLDPTRAGWHYQLGRVLEEVGDNRAAHEAYAAGLRVDSKAGPRHAQLLADTPWHFPPRRRLVDFVADHLEEIRERAEPGVQPLTDPTIYVYWAQGIAQAPEVVQRCHEELQRLHEPGQIVVLDDSVWDELRVPELTRERTRHRLAHGSDVLRLELLSRRGGIWVDATCLLREPLPPLVPQLAPTGFFAFERASNRLSNWMLISAPGHYITVMLREALHAYWQHFDWLVDYYIFHHLFEALCIVDTQFREQWLATPRPSARQPHAFTTQRFEPYDPQRYRELLDSYFVHKLSYKKQERMTPDSMIARFMRDGVQP